LSRDPSLKPAGNDVSKTLVRFSGRQIGSCRCRLAVAARYRDDFAIVEPGIHIAVFAPLFRSAMWCFSAVLVKSAAVKNP
jgi:hypothetical protein